MPPPFPVATLPAPSRSDPRDIISSNIHRHPPVAYIAADDPPVSAYVHGLPRQQTSLLHHLRADCSYTRGNLHRIGIEQRAPTVQPAAHRKRCLKSFSIALYALHNVQCCYLPWTRYSSLAYPCHCSSSSLDASLTYLLFRKL